MKVDFIRFDYLTHKIRMMKTAIVTGASGNMGQAVVKKFLKEGYHVIGTALEHDTTIMDVEDPKFIKVVVDLMDEAAASVKMAMSSMPEHVAEYHKRMSQLQVEKEALHIELKNAKK